MEPALTNILVHSPPPSTALHYSPRSHYFPNCTFCPPLFLTYSTKASTLILLFLYKLFLIQNIPLNPLILLLFNSLLLSCNFIFLIDSKCKLNSIYYSALSFHKVLILILKPYFNLNSIILLLMLSLFNLNFTIYISQKHGWILFLLYIHNYHYILLFLILHIYYQ
jgi:hypothetical protein